MVYLRRFALVLAALMGSLSLLVSTGAGASSRAASPAADPTVEVVVTLPQPPLARAILADRTLAAATTARHRLNVRAPAAVSYLRTLASAQRTLQARIATAIPDAAVRWHYDVTLNGIAVSLPRSQLHRLSTLPGATVWPSVTYHSLAQPAVQLIGAPTLWGSSLATAGQGIKIGIIDDGLDQSHVYFDPTGFAYPAGFPKGQTAYTTPKVIVARAFSPASNHWKNANLPFDPAYSDHATHVAGIAAGDYNTQTAGVTGRPRISGVAPAAYIGNYKVLTVPTSSFGLDGNSPEIAKGIEAAVADGMDVINLSLGEPEIEPSRDIVVAALQSAAAAGVTPVVAAGNDGAPDGDMLGALGSVGSPGTAPDAITVAAATPGGDGAADVIAGFSSEGPTPRSLELKPDVTAPGVNILSSFPGNQWTTLDGTSMATPHVAGGAAILKQRHPSWTVAQIKSALEATGDPVHASDSSNAELSPLREGGGRIDLPRADNPLVFTTPTSLSFGLVHVKSTAVQQVTLSDAGGGAAPWNAAVQPQTTPAGTTLTLSAPTAAAGSVLTLTVTAAATAASGDATGFVVLSRGSDVRRIPYWAHIENPRLGTERQHALSRPGIYGGTTAGGRSLVSSYRYPEGPLQNGVPTNLSGPEEVFKVTVRKPIANFGAVILSRAKGVGVSPRIVESGDENRLVGYSALPVDINPYQSWGSLVPAVAAIAPRPGVYQIVFDTPAGARPGRFTFRFWTNDVSPPTVRLVSRRIPPGSPVLLVATDAGSGVDPRTISATIDGRHAGTTFGGGHLRVSTAGVGAGAHRLSVRVSDYEEAKNMENVGPILPNTRTLTGTFTVR